MLSQEAKAGWSRPKQNDFCFQSPDDWSFTEHQTDASRIELDFTTETRGARRSMELTPEKCHSIAAIAVLLCAPPYLHVEFAA
jgi:hypothetical protein